MADINLRKVPDDLARRIKAFAAFKGVTMRDFILSTLEKEIEEKAEQILRHKRDRVR